MTDDNERSEANAARPPKAGSVARDPKNEPTPQGHDVPIDAEDAPKGQPTSDRFQTEQAHKPGKKDAEDP